MPEFVCTCVRACTCACMSVRHGTWQAHRRARHRRSARCLYYQERTHTPGTIPNPLNALLSPPSPRRVRRRRSTRPTCSTRRRWPTPQRPPSPSPSRHPGSTRRCEGVGVGVGMGVGVWRMDAQRAAQSFQPSTLGSETRHDLCHECSLHSNNDHSPLPCHSRRRRKRRRRKRRSRTMTATAQHEVCVCVCVCVCV